MSWNFVNKPITLAIVLMTSLPMSAHAYCDWRPYPTPNDVVQAEQNFLPCLEVGHLCNSVVNGEVFQNYERRLPYVQYGESYYAARVYQPNYGYNGAWRLVFLLRGQPHVQGSRVLVKYFTWDHYLSFCQLP